MRPFTNGCGLALLLWASLGGVPVASAQEVLREHFLPSQMELVAEDLGLVGDVDMDGVGDYFVSTWRPDLGVVDMYSGAGGELLWRYRIIQNGQPVRWSAPAGDFDGDGIADVAWSDWVIDTPLFDCGQVTILSGVDGTPVATIRGWIADLNLGRGVAGVGDTNGDGYDDLLIGTDLGIYLFLGPDGRIARDHFLLGAMAPAGDVNADGYADYLIGSPGTNEAFVFSGVDGSELWCGEGTYSVNELGEAVSTAGDVDGDGHDDFLVAMGHGGVQLEPSVTMYSGKDGSVLMRLENTRPDLLAGLSRRGRALDGRFDVNGDGVRDILSGANERLPGPQLLFRDTRRIVSGATGATLWKVWEDGFGIRHTEMLGDLDQDGYADWGYVFTDTIDGEGVSGARILRGGPGDALPGCSGGTNSLGSRAELALPFGQSIAGTYFRLRTLNAVPEEPGIFFCGSASPGTPFGDGELCTGGNLERFPAVTASDKGAAWLDVDVTVPPASAFLPGTSRSFQYWYRDPASPSGFNLSSSLTVTFTSH